MKFFMSAMLLIILLYVTSLLPLSTLQSKFPPLLILSGINPNDVDDTILTYLKDHKRFHLLHHLL